MLTDAKIKAAKPADKNYKLGDSGQLYLLVTKAGGKLWRMNYTFGKNAAGKPVQKTLTFGNYPALTLVEARGARDRAKAQLREGFDPQAQRLEAQRAKSASDENTFELVAIKWFELKSGWSVEKFRDWCAERDGKWSKRDAANWMTNLNAGWSVVHSGDVLRSLDRDVFPEIGKLPVTELESPRLLDVLNRVVERGAIETAHRICQRINDIYIYAIPAGLATRNPAASMGKALPKKPRARKQPSIVDRIRDHDARIAAVQKLMRDCDDQRCRAATKFALRLIALTAVRPNEIHNARWDELEGLGGPEPIWRIPAERMKGDDERKGEIDGDHLVPLSRQAVEAINALRLLTGNYALMFPSERSVHNPMSENTLRDLLIRAGYYKRHVPHGFRAAFSTIMNERPDRKDGDRAVIDLMLAHVPENKVEGAYNRAEYMPRRREIAQEWGDLITVELEPPEALIGRPIRYAATGPGREIECE